MTAFAVAIGAIFADRNMAQDALWRPGGTGAPVPVRVIRRAPDAEVSWGEARARIPAVLLDVRTTEAPTLASGDEIEVGGVAYRVQGAPRRDSLRLMWTAEAVEV
jgi:hypothetical protein